MGCVIYSQITLISGYTSALREALHGDLIVLEKLAD